MGAKEELNKLLINYNETIMEAMKLLDKTAQKNLYVVDENNRLIGSVSDGDIRRCILKGIELKNSVEQIMNHNPKRVYDTDANKNKRIKELLLEYHVESIPIVNKDNNIVDILYWTDIFKTERKQYSKKSTKVFILAGGIGTRLEPFTRVLPKPLIPIGDTPILEKIMDNFSRYGFREFILSLNYKSDMIKAYLSDIAVNSKYDLISYITESYPMGTIGSLSLAKEQLKESFFITNCDIIVEEDMEKIYDFHKQSKNILTIVGCGKKSLIPYGVLDMDKDGKLLEIIEKPEFYHLINTGMYLAEPEIIEYLEDGKKTDMTELINLLIEDGRDMGIFPILDGQWFDIGQWGEFEQTRKYFEKNL